MCCAHFTVLTRSQVTLAVIHVSALPTLPTVTAKGKGAEGKGGGTNSNLKGLYVWCAIEANYRQILTSRALPCLAPGAAASFAVQATDLRGDVRLQFFLHRTKAGECSSRIQTGAADKDELLGYLW